LILKENWYGRAWLAPRINDQAANEPALASRMAVLPVDGCLGAHLVGQKQTSCVNPPGELCGPGAHPPEPPGDPLTQMARCANGEDESTPGGSGRRKTGHESAHLNLLQMYGRVRLTPASAPARATVAAVERSRQLASCASP
jgi:hypothetical protein